MAKADRERKFFKISLVLDAFIMSTFLALNTVTNLGNRDIWLTITYFLVSAILIILANFIIYQFWVKRKT